MKKLTIEEASKHFSITKEAVHNRIRRGKLKATIENGEKFVVIDEITDNNELKQENNNSKQDYNKYVSKLEEENSELKTKMELLEKEIKNLRDDKEQLLIAQKEEIKRVYESKDEQLKSILNLLNTKFLTQSMTENKNNHHSQSKSEKKPQKSKNDEILEAELHDENQKGKIELSQMLLEKGLNETERKRIKARFNKRVGTREIIKKQGKIYISPNEDYSELLKP